MRAVVSGSGHAVVVVIVGLASVTATDDVVQDLVQETGEGCFLLCNQRFCFTYFMLFLGISFCRVSLRKPDICSMNCMKTNSKNAFNFFLQKEVGLDKECLVIYNITDIIQKK